MVFGFGLIHGFGLSTRLQQLPLGNEGIVAKIIAFNVGVELGQVAALSIMLLLLMGWRQTSSFSKFSRASNVGLLIVGGILTLLQLHSYQHTAFADDFPISKDDHYHAHEAMQSSQVPSPLQGYKKRILINPDELEQKAVDRMNSPNFQK